MKRSKTSQEFTITVRQIAEKTVGVFFKKPDRYNWEYEFRSPDEWDLVNSGSGWAATKEEAISEAKSRIDLLRHQNQVKEASTEEYRY